jgi:hypothetical protein
MTKKTIFTLIFLVATTALADTYHVYDADQLVIGRYLVRQIPGTSTYHVYDLDQIVIPKYIVRPTYPGSNNFNLYDPRESTIIQKGPVKGK